MTALQDAHKKTRVVELAIEIESQLLRAMTQNNTYSDSLNDPATEEMRLGNPPDDGTLRFDLCSDRIGGDCLIDEDIRNGQTLCFQSLTNSRDGACNFAPNSPDMVQVTLSNVRLGAAGPGVPRFLLDYSMQGNPAYGKLAMMGSSDLTAGGDYSVQIPVEAYQSIQDSECSPIPGYDVVVGVNGFDKSVNPYRVTCIRIANGQPLTCPQRTFPKTLSSVPIGGSNDLRLQMDCGGPARTLTCPTGYALQGFSPQTLDPAVAAPIGSCIYHGQDSITTASAFSDANGLIQGEVCPPNYVVDYGLSTCQITSGPTAVNGTCRNWATSCTSCDYTLPTPSQDCSYNPVDTAQPPVGPVVAEFINTSPATRTAICRLRTDPQACGARWQATLEMRVHCRLVVPQTAGAN